MITLRIVAFTCLFSIISLLAYSQPTRQIAITLDDLPFAFGGSLSPEQQESNFRKVLEVLSKYHITCTGFAIGNSVTDQNKHLLNEFLKNGHQLGNHTFSHPDLNAVSAFAYGKDIEKADLILSPWLTQPKYFRFPYLRQGNTQAKRDSVKSFLGKAGYQIVPVSIDNDEWVYNRDFVKANTQSNKKQADRIGEAYIGHLQERTAFFEKLATEKLGRSVPHILLLHMNSINAYFLEELLGWYKQQGWQFITVTQALKDPLYQMSDTYLGERGISILERIQP